MVEIDAEEQSMSTCTQSLRMLGMQAQHVHAKRAHVVFPTETGGL